MKKRKKGIRYLLLSIAVFVGSVLLAIVTRMCLVADTTFWNFDEDQASLITSMIEGIVGALSIGIVVFQLHIGNEAEKHQNDIEEGKFILQYNRTFIQDPNMCDIEQRLEMNWLGTLKESLVTDDNRQAFINYLTYLEGLAPLVLGDVLKLEHIDDLMAYRYFLAVNTPELQQDQLFIFPDYYRGCFKLYEKWKQYRLDKGYPILREETSIDKWDRYREYSK